VSREWLQSRMATSQKICRRMLRKVCAFALEGPLAANGGQPHRTLAWGGGAGLQPTPSRALFTKICQCMSRIQADLALNTAIRN